MSARRPNMSTTALAEVRRVGDLYDRSFTDRFHTIAQYEQGIATRALLIQEERMVLEGLAEDVAAPFGLDWRTLDGLALDTLGWTTPEGEHWRWHGRTANGNRRRGRAPSRETPVVRLRRTDGGSLNTEWTAHRILHRILVTDHEPPGAMHPRCDAPFICVRLSHRCPRCSL